MPSSFSLPLVLLTFTPIVNSLPARIDRRSIVPIYDGSLVSGKTYDYVIAGGGLTGSVLASRLSEDSSKSVLIVEAGYDESVNPIAAGKSNSSWKNRTWLT